MASREERRLLILAPVGRDAALIESLLGKDTVLCAPCRDLDHLACEIQTGVGAILIAEEAIAHHESRLAAIMREQPPWSDIPMLVLTFPGADSTTVTTAVDTLGNVTLLERPVRVRALASAVRSALRARDRQYQTRAYLADREQADQRKDQFLATLAHELRNPLAPIRTSLEVMRLSPSGASVTTMSEIMERQVNQLVRLVDDLIDVSRITRGKVELRMDPVDLAAVIATAVETSRPLIDSGKHELVVGIQGGALVVDADAMRLAQVFSNLLNNAARYTDAGGRISIDARREAGRAVVTVSDTGIGIQSDALCRVFDLFTQADDRDRHSQTGLGIGLTLARSLVEMHGGTIAAESEGAGKGSRFIVRLPLSTAITTSGTRSAASPPVMKGSQRVLVVDDNGDAADTLGALLEMLGAEVQIAYDGSAALLAMEAFQPGVVVLDLGMPGMDGYEVARRIRERPGSGQPTLIALTGWGQEKDRQLTETAGFDIHLIKPVDLRALQGVLASLT